MEVKWIKWGGGEWQGDKDALVHVKFADGQESTYPAKAGDIKLNWKTKHSYQWETSIIAFRLVN